jgi:hypothetical protein
MNDCCSNRPIDWAWSATRPLRGVDKLGLDCGHVFRPPRNADVVSNGSYIGRLGGFPGNFASAEMTIGNVSAPLQGAFGTFTPTIGGFTSEVGTKGPRGSSGRPATGPVSRAQVTALKSLVRCL